MTDKYLRCSIMTTKGDVLIYGSGADRLAIGANNTVLVPDSAEDKGMKWSSDPDLNTVEVVATILKETTTPSSLADHGKIYTKSDNKLYFQDGAGTEKEIAFV